MIGKALAVIGGYVVLTEAKENADRWQAYGEARTAADTMGRPLLNIGCPRMYPFKYPCGDVCLDIDPARLNLCQSKQPSLADVRSIPFPDGYFGAVLCTHVLEHLPTPADAEQAVSEMMRVSGGRVFVAIPSKASILAWLHPEHSLWITESAGGRLYAEARTGVGDAWTFARC